VLRVFEPDCVNVRRNEADPALDPAPEEIASNAVSESVMPHFYVDDSVQDRGNFVLGAVVFGPDAELSVSAAIKSVGLTPGIHEFKSSIRMSEHPEQVKLREDLRSLLSGYRIGVLIVPHGERSNLGHYALQAIDQFVNANGLRNEADLRVFLDQGMFASSRPMKK
jgi:hypothetical protein